MQQDIKGWYEFLDKPLAYTSYYTNPKKTLSINIESLHIDWRDKQLCFNAVALYDKNAV